MPSLHAAAIDPCVCPLCGQPNRCAMETAKATGEALRTCWCVNVNFSQELLARVPSSAARKACICETCARQASTTPEAAPNV